MKWVGNVRKMGSLWMSMEESLTFWRGADILDLMEVLLAGDWVGQHVKLELTATSIVWRPENASRSTYGEGLSYDAFLKSLSWHARSIIRPELWGRIHEGIALRDEAWERANHLQPHVVYISQTSHLKVGGDQGHERALAGWTKGRLVPLFWPTRLTASLPERLKWP